MTDEEKRKMVRNKIGSFFDTLYQEHKVAVQHVTLEWAEQLNMGEHDKYLLVDINTNIKL